MKFPSVPRPPDTTMFASVNSGRPPFTGGCEELMRAFFASALIDAVAFSIAGVDALKSAYTLFGRTVITGVPCETCECTVVEPPNTD